MRRGAPCASAPGCRSPRFGGPLSHRGKAVSGILGRLELAGCVKRSGVTRLPDGRFQTKWQATEAKPSADACLRDAGASCRSSRRQQAPGRPVSSRHS
jgi:hypothetical protein